MRVFSCPRCRGQQKRLGERCIQCGADLTALMRIVERADAAHDAAVRAARAGRWAEAGEQASVALAFVPDDVDTIVLLAKIAHRQGRRKRSAELWERVGELDPDRADVPVALAELRKPAARVPARRSKRKRKSGGR
jgi:predicted Zn-dependent protease